MHATQTSYRLTNVSNRGFMRPHRRAASWPRPRLSSGGGGGAQRSRDGRRRTSAAGHATENNTLFSPTRALRVPEPCRRAITSRPGVLARFSPFARAVDGPFAVPALGSHSRCSHFTPRLESSLQQLRSSRFGVASPLLVLPRESPRASSIAHRIWPSDATSSRLHVTLTAFSTMT